MNNNLTSIDANRFPKLAYLSSVLREKHRVSGDIADRGYLLFGDVWADEFEQVLDSLFPTNQATVDAVKGYAAFSVQSMRLQRVFELERHYKDKSYQNALSEVYFNEVHMMQEYLPGLLLSHFLWPHHYRQIQFFKSAFLHAMSVGGATSFMEVGIGTGLYSRLLLSAMPHVRGLGFDISPYSKLFTEKHLAAIGVANRYKTELLDVAAEPIEPKANWLVCVEVLEHLDDPVAFLKGLRRNMASGAKAFVTAALNAAHPDHIFLYRNSEEVREHLTEAGFTLEQSYTGSAYKSPVPGVPVPEVAAFVVY
jgi:hypothetical protein